MWLRYYVMGYKLAHASNGAPLRQPQDPLAEMNDGGGVGRRRLRDDLEPDPSDAGEPLPKAPDTNQDPGVPRWSPAGNTEHNVMSGINMAFQTNADFGNDTSRMPQPPMLNPALNPVVGPGMFGNKTDTAGGYIGS